MMEALLRERSLRLILTEWPAEQFGIDEAVVDSVTELLGVVADQDRDPLQYRPNGQGRLAIHSGTSSECINE